MGWRSIYYSLVAAFGFAVLLTPYPLTYSGFHIGWGLFVAGLLYFFTGAWHLYRVRPDRPLTDLIESGGAPLRHAVDRIALFVSGALFLTWLPPLKTMIPAYAGFWADPMLIEVDRFLLGADAFDLAHSVTPLWARNFIDIGYAMWPFVMIVTTAFIVVVGRNVGQFMLAWALTWVLLGVVAATALASAGPLFGPELGLGFHHVSETLDGTINMSFKNMLWAGHSTDTLELGGGISAAPSMHCAVSFLFLFAAWRTHWRIPALLYVAFIWFGSVYLGWHYAVDGLLSLIGTALIWRWAGKLARRRKAADVVADGATVPITA